MANINLHWFEEISERLIHLFSIFNIKTPQALAALVPLGLLIVKTLTNVLLTITRYGLSSIAM